MKMGWGVEKKKKQFELRTVEQLGEVLETARIKLSSNDTPSGNDQPIP